MNFKYVIKTVFSSEIALTATTFYAYNRFPSVKSMKLVTIIGKNGAKQQNVNMRKFCDIDDVLKSTVVDVF